MLNASLDIGLRVGVVSRIASVMEPYVPKTAGASMSGLRRVLLHSDKGRRMPGFGKAV
jgi:hypothetical protein